MVKRQVIRRTILFLVFLAFPITLNYYSPYLIMQSASEGTANFSFFFYTGGFLASLFLGRLVCAYLCPLGAAQMLADSMIDKRLKRIKHLNIVKYVLAVAWVGAIIYFAVSAGGYKRINLLYNTESGISVDDASRLIMYYIIISAPLIPVFFLGKRAFCHYFCPFGVLNIAGVKIAQLLRLPSLHVKADPDQCKQCKRCEQACPKSLLVSQMVQNGAINHAECMQCGTCVDTCKFGTVRYAWKRQVAHGSLEPQSQLSG